MEGRIQMELGKFSGKFRLKQISQDSFLAWMYGHWYGRVLLRPLVSPWFSILGGKVLESRLSALAIPGFVRKNGIDLSICEKQKFDSFNDFFTRKLKEGSREICQNPNVLVSPCDSRLSVYKIEENRRFQVKQTSYTLEQLLKNKKLAEKYAGGTLWLLRLCVDDYHRYIYPVTGEKTRNVRISGVYHTVNPIANDVYPIYKENTREYCLLKSNKFGKVLMMEVGAMLVGKIENACEGKAEVFRGEEKGNFAFGGSTIILLTEKNAVVPEALFEENTKAGIETRVKLGEVIGKIAMKSSL